MTVRYAHTIADDADHNRDMRTALWTRQGLACFVDHLDLDFPRLMRNR